MSDTEEDEPLSEDLSKFETRPVTFACGHSMDVVAVPASRGVSQEQFEEIMAMRLTEPCTDCLHHRQSMWLVNREAEDARFRAAQAEAQRKHDALFLAAIREVVEEIRALREELKHE